MKTRDRPTYTKWKRKVGGAKVCPVCGHRNPAVTQQDGRPVRPKFCLVPKCGAALIDRDGRPIKLTGAKEVRWYVREFSPITCRTKDYACKSSEDAEEFIRRRERDWTPDPIQERLIEHASVLCRQIQAAAFDDAVDLLIQKLGGDPTRRKLKVIGWDEAVSTIADELRQKGKAGSYIEELRRVAADLRAITGASEWSALDLDSVAKYRSVRMAGGWKRGERTIKGVGGRAINKDLATLSAFLTRATRKHWVAKNVLADAPDERIKVAAVRVEYMPDEDLKAILAAADVWMRTFVTVAYYTGARRGDLLRLEWDRDVDLDGKKAEAEGRTGPHVYVRGAKADTPHWMPLHRDAVEALKELRQQPVIGPKVFHVRSRNPDSAVSHMFADLCVKVGVVETVDRDGKAVVKNKWSLHDLRRKANTDLRNRGASPKERAALLGHRSVSVNEGHYEAMLPSRERELVDGLKSFGKAKVG